MGIEDNVSKGLFAKTTSLKHKSTIFTIGKRGEILNQQLEAPIIVPHAQLKNRVSGWILPFAYYESICVLFLIRHLLSVHL